MGEIHFCARSQVHFAVTERVSIWKRVERKRTLYVISLNGGYVINSKVPEGLWSCDSSCRALRELYLNGLRGLGFASWRGTLNRTSQEGNENSCPIYIRGILYMQDKVFR